MDFCSEVVGTTVSASQVSSDTYEVTNLISAGRSNRTRGFMVERFIKPPVDITFVFPCTVDLHQVVLCTAVGCQRSVGIDVLGLVSDQTKKPTVQIPSSAPSHRETVISKCFLQDGEDRICFINRRYRPRPPFSEWRESEVPDGVPTRDIYNLPPRVCGLRLRLWRSGNGSLLAMKSVQIHAAPSWDTPVNVVGRLLALVKPPTTLTTLEPKKSAPPPSKKETESSKTKQYDFNASQQMRIPPEFLDPLTCEIMTFPVILPSGTTVDQSSLDRHVQSESNWGRAPSDPFTGVPLVHSDAKRRVLPNTLLKTRIDRYLLLNVGSTTSGIGRTTGVKRGHPDDAGAVTSKLARVENQPAPTKLTEPDPKPDVETRPEGAVSRDDADVECKTSGDHLLRLDRSLDSALKSALGSLTRYSGAGARPNRWERVFAPPPGCGSCSADETGKKTPLYRLPCSHLVCRDCVTAAVDVAAKGQTCSTCGATYASSDLARVHLS